jgi:hypothetical protein
MTRDQILQRARELADAMLPDPSIIPPTPELRAACVRAVARRILRHRLDVIVTWLRFAGGAS